MVLALRRRVVLGPHRDSSAPFLWAAQSVAPSARVSVSGWGSVMGWGAVLPGHRWWRSHGRTGGFPTPRISKRPFLSTCLLKDAVCLHMAGHLDIQLALFFSFSGKHMKSLLDISYQYNLHFV